MQHATEAAKDPDAAARGTNDVDDDAPPPGEYTSMKLWTVRLLTLGIVFTSWEAVSGRLVQELFIGKPTEIAVVLWEWLSSGFIFEHLFVTLQETALGFIFGSLAGIGVGFLLGRFVFLGRAFDPIISALYALPKLALAPLFVLWFGIGLSMKIAMGAVIVFFLVFYNTFHGVRDVDADLIDVSRVLGANRREVLRKVVLPSSLPMIYVGLRMAVPYSLIGAVVGEIIAANRGLGWLIAFSAGQFRTNDVFAGLIILMVLAVGMNIMLSTSERYSLRWKPSV